MLKKFLKFEKILHIFVLLFICLIMTFTEDSAINYSFSMMQIQNFDFSEHRSYAIPSLWILTAFYSVYVVFKLRKK